MSESNSLSPAYVNALAASLGLACTYLLKFSSGPWLWLLLTAALLAILHLAQTAFRALTGRKPITGFTPATGNAAMLVATLGLTTCTTEAGLGLWEQQGDQVAMAEIEQQIGSEDSLLLPGLFSDEALQQVAARKGPLVLPEAWRRKRVYDIEGAHVAYIWHEILHVLDKRGFRRSEPFPEKEDSVFRIVAIGDSLTFGYGIEERFGYPALIANYLQSNYRVEVLNLGISGYQSEDILRVGQDLFPPLQPDLVIYGVCLNDFLPSGEGQNPDTRWAFPIPDTIKAYLIEHSRVARLMNDAYMAGLIALGLRHSFMQQILNGFDTYQVRFRRDVIEFGNLIQSVTGQSGIGMVLHQSPVEGGQAQEVTQIAESYLAEAGFRVVPTDAYFKHYDGQALRVSRWEGHPNELANALFASMMIPAIESLPKLQAYRR